MIYVMRHGQSLVNIDRRIRCRHREGDLTTKGYNQAHKAGVWLIHKDISAIYTSPFERTRRTADIIAKQVDQPVIIDNDLREMDCGDLEDRTDNEGWAIWNRTFDRWVAGEASATFPGGESFEDAFIRFARLLRGLPTHSNTLVITHGGLMRSVIPYLCINAAALQRVKVPSNTGMIVLEPYDSMRFICEAWDICYHLGDMDD